MAHNISFINELIYQYLRNGTADVRNQIGIVLSHKIYLVEIINGFHSTPVSTSTLKQTNSSTKIIGQGSGGLRSLPRRFNKL